MCKWHIAIVHAFYSFMLKYRGLGLLRTNKNELERCDMFWVSVIN